MSVTNMERLLLWFHLKATMILQKRNITMSSQNRENDLINLTVFILDGEFNIGIK